MVPLNTTTAFTLLQSPMLPQTLVQKAQERGFKAVGLADHDVLYGMAEFTNAARALDMQPILGLKATLVGLQTTASNFTVAFYVQNQVGYHNLIKLSSYLKTHEQAPDFATIQPFLAGLYVVIPPVSELAVLLLSDTTRAISYVKQLLELVPAEHLFLGVELKMSTEQIQQIQYVAGTTKTKIIAFDEVAYLDPADQFGRIVLQQIGVGEPLANLGAAQNLPAHNYLRDAKTWANEYRTRGLGEAIEQTDWIAEHSQYTMASSQVTLPTFKTPNQQTAKDYLYQIAMEGLKVRLHGLKVDGAIYQQRLAEELQIIDNLNFNDYFLIVGDVIDFAHKHNIRTGPGRGSAAGSLVAYALHITDVDPIAYDLLFERFLNPERVAMPDIDIDIQSNQRKDVIEYVYAKYGYERFAQINSFQTLKAKATIDDVAKIFGLSLTQAANLKKGIGKDQTLQEAYAASQAFRNALLDIPVDSDLFYKTAQQLEGIPRDEGLHAAGIVLSFAPLVDTIPVRLGEDGRLVTQLTKTPVEKLGLLKIDFLGLTNLNILDIALNEVKKENPDDAFDINKIDFNDAKTLNLFKQGLTNGVFQFESSGMKNMLRQLQPDTFEDLVAANAIFRPGPMQFIPNFIARKHGREAIVIPDPAIANIVEPTYGIIVYQEQVMRVAQQFAGFSLGQADLLRRAMSKKDAAEIANLKKRFIDGAVKQGHAPEIAQQVYGYIEPFAQYGFNRSHAVAYSKLGFQLAYLKAHFPTAFFKAVLNEAIGDAKKTKAYLAEIKTTDVIVQGPDINQSWAGFSTHNKAIRMGLASIRGVRRDFREAMLQERQANGVYKNLGDLIGRLDNKYRKVETIEPLIYAGAFDSFNPNRKAILDSMQGYIDAIGLAGESMSLFETLAPKTREVTDYTQAEKLAYELDYLGFYLSGHPIETILAAIPAELHANVISLNAGDKNIKTILYIENVKTIRTKKGDQMAFVDGMDMTGSISVTVFPKLFEKISHLLQPEQTIAVVGDVEQQRGRDAIQLVANQISDVHALVTGKQRVENTTPATGQWYIKVPNTANLSKINLELEAIFKTYHGNNPVLVVYAADNRKIALNKPQWLTTGPKPLRALEALLGVENVVFKPI
ncbi:MAG: DNA polymerase III subunit alpha [Lactobacillaceae bacterium]|jgi:DNA polymerase-3 subunit alpha|nr:DNA polymerase III subunit alpha [Lactobacillaceae bacterium]